MHNHIAGDEWFLINALCLIMNCLVEKKSNLLGICSELNDVYVFKQIRCIRSGGGVAGKSVGPR